MENKAVQDINEIMRKLREPFPAKDVEFRVQRVTRNKKAVVLAYITSRAVMDRLDSVFGLDGWQDTYSRWGENSVKCSLSVCVNGRWITKEDGADDTSVEATKGGFSDALKRVAVKLGIGRYLYNLPEMWVDIKERGQHYINDRGTGITGYWDDPKLPDWALPGGSGEPFGGNSQSKATSNPSPASKSAPAPSKKEEAKEDATESKPATPTLLNAIKRSAQLLSSKGVNVTVDSLLKEHCGGKKLEDLTHDEAQSVISVTNRMFAEL